MEYASFSERVTLERERFTEFEEAFSLYAIANPEEVASQTIKDIAATFHIAPNAIMRLARKLDYEGFSEMRLALKREGGISTACQAAHEEGGREKAASRPGTLALVEKTLRLCCTRDHLLPAARILTGSKRTVFYAVGETAYITHAFANRMSDFDEKTHFLTYENQIRRELTHRDGLALVLVSLSGQTPQVVSFARKASEAGVPTVTITDLHPCPLACYATTPLYCCSPERRIGEVTATDLTPLAATLSALEQAYFEELGVL